MARPIKRVVDYFPHDCNHGQILFILENKYGNDGYAAYYKIPEVVGLTDAHCYDARGPEAWEYLLAYLHIEEQKVFQILNTLASLGYIDPELWSNKVIWCQDMVDRVKDVYVRRKVNLPLKPGIEQFETRQGDIANNKSDNVNNNHIDSPTNHQSKVKESKVDITPKGVRKKRTDPQSDPRVKEIFDYIKKFFGYPDKTDKDPIPSYGMEGQAVKRMLTRRFTREEILACWNSKVSQRGGEFVSMKWVNQDIGNFVSGGEALPASPGKGQSQAMTADRGISTQKGGTRENKGQRVKGSRPASDFIGKW